MSFANLKKNSGKGNFEQLKKNVADSKSGGYEKEEGFWNFEVDKAGNGYAVIRFLPAPEGEESPFVKIFSHAFKNEKTNKWYIENSLTTLGQDDPVAEANSIVWQSGKAGEQQIRDQKRSRKTTYISNIMVISDPKNPDNDGKVFKFKYGVKIFQKIEGAISPPPEFKDETPFNPFDFWEGANFKLKARVVDKQRSYDKSEFEKPTPLFDDDDALRTVYEALPSLAAHIAPDKFKTYDELKKKFNQVMGSAGPDTDDGDTDGDGIGKPTAKSEVSRKSDKPKAAPAETANGDDLEAYASLLRD